MSSKQRAAARLIEWLEAKSIDFPWQFSRDPRSGELFFVLPIAAPHRGILILKRSRYVLLLTNLADADKIEDATLGSWTDSPGEIFRALLVTLFDKAAAAVNRFAADEATALGLACLMCAEAISDYELMAKTICQVMTPLFISQGKEEKAETHLAQFLLAHGEKLSEERRAEILSAIESLATAE